MTTVNPTTYCQMRDQASAEYLRQTHFLSWGPLAPHYPPLSSYSQFCNVAKFAMNGIQALGPIDWSTTGVGTPGVMQGAANPSRAAVLQAVLDVEMSGQPVRYRGFTDAVEFVIALLMQEVQTQLATGNYGATTAAQFAQIQIWTQQAQTA